MPDAWAFYGLTVGYLLAYLPALSAFFVKDDLAVITTTQVDFPHLFARPWLGGFFRPMAELLFGIQHWMFGLNPLPYHLVSLLAHAGAVYIIYELFSLLLGDRAKALVTALIFGLHPINTEVVSWISGQMSLFSGLCGFLVLFLMSSQPGKYKPLWFIALSMVFIAGLGFYENFIVVPGIWVATYLFCKNVRLEHRSGFFLAWFLLFVGITGCYIYWRFVVLDLHRGYYNFIFSFKTALVNFFYYLYLLTGGSMIGGRIIRYHPGEMFSGSNLLDVFPPLLIVNTLLLIVTWGIFIKRILKGDEIHWRDISNILLAGAWAFVALLPAIFLSERPRRLAYLAAPAYSLLICQALFYLQQKIRCDLRFARAGLIGYAVLLALTLHLRNQDWRAVGNTEKNIPEIVARSTSCSCLIFDVPNLIGDALFFNNLSIEYWVKRKTEYRNIAVYEPHQIVGELPPNTCLFRLVNSHLEPIQLKKGEPFPVFIRGNNWIKRGDLIQ